MLDEKTCFTRLHVSRGLLSEVDALLYTAFSNQPVTRRELGLRALETTHSAQKHLCCYPLGPRLQRRRSRSCVDPPSILLSGRLSLRLPDKLIFQVLSLPRQYCFSYGFEVQPLVEAGGFRMRLQEDRTAGLVCDIACLRQKP